MLPTTLPHSNGALGSRDAARHTAGAKRYKYLRRLLHFRQMDFEFAVWQMLYLFTSPQRVYRNFHYRKQTKDQWARDDPAFLVLLSIWLCGEFASTTLTLNTFFFNKYVLQICELKLSIRSYFTNTRQHSCPVSTTGFGLVLDMGVMETLKLLLWVVFVDCIGVGLLISTLMWYVCICKYITTACWVSF